VAKGAHNLADVMLLTKGDLPKAEELVRESLRIRLLRFGKDHDIVGMSYDLLSNILQAQHKIGDELKEIMIRYIAISIRNEGPDCIKTALGNQKLGMDLIFVINVIYICSYIHTNIYKNL
jgi:hypothetical protein